MNLLLHVIKFIWDYILSIKLLHDSFGTKNETGNLFSVMKNLLDIRDKVRKDN